MGCEVYVTEESYLKFDRSNKRYHLILLAENNEGFNNIMKIVSEGFVHGYYYKPRVDYEVLRKYSRGIIATSACLAGEVKGNCIPEIMMEQKKRLLTIKIFLEREISF